MNAVRKAAAFFQIRRKVDQTAGQRGNIHAREVERRKARRIRDEAAGNLMQFAMAGRMLAASERLGNFLRLQMERGIQTV